MTLKDRIQDDMKAAMRAKDKDRLGTIRLIMAAIKQREVDERITLDDSQILAVLEKMLKQRRESIAQYESAGRDELAAKEQSEADVIQGYMPTALTDEELDALIDKAIADTGAESPRDMGKVMAVLKQQAQGRIDMGAASGRVKTRLNG